MPARTPTGIIQASNWARHSPPNHPCFENEIQIRRIVDAIKWEVDNYLLDGARTLFADRKAPVRDFASPQVRACWLLALKAQRYGVIYFLSRSDARAANEYLTRSHGQVIAQAGRILADDGNSNRIFNYAVCRYVRSERRTVSFFDDFIPQNAFYSLGPDHLAVRESDFFSADPQAALQTGEALYDLHDFAHQACATLCPGIYGNKYLAHLHRIPARLKALVVSPGLRTAQAVPLSDGLVFSELLLGIYDGLDHSAPPDVLVDMIAAAAVPYYLDGQALLHPSTGTWMKADAPVTTEQLMMLAQNKFYELPASEIEQKMFVRGGNDDRDPLGQMTTLERVAFIGHLARHWLYYEQRNTLRHRAHLETYRRIAARLQEQSCGCLERRLLRVIMDKMSYRAHVGGHDPDLCHVLEDPAAVDARFKPQPPG